MLDRFAQGLQVYVASLGFGGQCESASGSMCDIHDLPVERIWQRAYLLSVNMDAWRVDCPLALAMYSVSIWTSGRELAEGSVCERANAALPT